MKNTHELEVQLSKQDTMLIRDMMADDTMTVDEEHYWNFTFEDGTIITVSICGANEWEADEWEADELEEYGFEPRMPYVYSTIHGKNFTMDNDECDGDFFSEYWFGHGDDEYVLVLYPYINLKSVCNRINPFLSMIDMEAVIDPDTGLIKLNDWTGANLADIESERFRSAADVIDRLDVYWDDYFVDEDYQGPDWCTYEDVRDWFKENGHPYLAEEIDRFIKFYDEIMKESSEEGENHDES